MYLFLARIIDSFYVKAADYQTVEPKDVGQVLDMGMALLNGTLFTVGPIIFVVMLAYLGVQRMTMSPNDADTLKRNSSALVWLVSGYAVSIGAFLVIKLVVSALGYTEPVGTINLPK